MLFEKRFNENRSYQLCSLEKFTHMFAQYKLKNKARRQVLRAKKMQKNDKLYENEEKLYEAGGF